MLSIWQLVELRKRIEAHSGSIEQRKKAKAILERCSQHSQIKSDEGEVMFNIFSSLGNDLSDWWKSLSAPKRPTPADFRRGVRKTRNIVSYSIDHNSANRGLFMGGITPFKRRFKGVSRTAKKTGK